MLRGVLRQVRRAWFRLTSPRVPVVYDARYQHGISGVPVDPMRGEKVVASLEDAGLLPRGVAEEPRAASLQNILRVHTQAYLEELQSGDALTRILGVPVPEVEAEDLVALHRLTVGGTIQATRQALWTGDTAVHVGGGYHHAMPDRGMGFCVFNDVAVTIARLRARGFIEKILVVDLDLHDGNGTRAIFAEDETVHTFSIHNDHWGDTDAVESTSIALGANVRDDAYLAALSESLPPVFAHMAPGLVIYLAGADPAGDDAIGNWKISAQGLFQRDRFVTALVRQARVPPPLVVLLAGGYGTRSWTHSARYLLWLASGREMDPPHEATLTLKRYRRLGDALAPRPTKRDDDLLFSFDASDLAGIDPGLRGAPRYLGALTRAEIELHLERLGVLDRLRMRGFRRLRVDLDADDVKGHTLRIVCEDRGEELLIELRMRRSLSELPGFEVLVIEWLLLQDPRAEFTPKRPRLPGQQHPGLGLLYEVFGWLVLLCEHHRLDGVYFTAAHFHIAAQARRLARCPTPDTLARFDAFESALSALSLSSAARAILEDRLVNDTTGEPVSWMPLPIVVSASDRLRAHLSEVERQAKRAPAPRLRLVQRAG